VTATASEATASRLFNPLRAMEIRFDGLQSVGGLRTINGARFGMVRNGGTKPHQGIDLYARSGTPIFAIADGYIEQVRYRHPAYGIDLLLRLQMSEQWIQHLARSGCKLKEGRLYAHYAHLSKIHIAKGKVKAGALLGATGTTGNADQRYPHLHFELRKAKAPGVGVAGLKNRIDPELILWHIDFSKPVEALERFSRTA